MRRDKITAYIPNDMAETLRRLAAIGNRSVSDMVEDAIGKAFSSAGRDAEHAALMARLDAIQRRLGVIQHGQETLFELCAHAARFAMSVTPEIGEADRAAFNARGTERFRNVVDAIVTRLSKGRSVWRDHFAVAATPPAAGAAASPAPRAAE
jgi:hypothetical protein